MCRRTSAVALACLPVLLALEGFSYAGPVLNEVGSFTATTTGTVSGAVLSTQYNLLFLRDGTSSIRIFNSITGAAVGVRSPSATGWFTDFSLSPSGRFLFAADYGGTNIGYNTPSSPSFVHRYDLQSGTWTSSQVTGIGHRLAAVDDSRVLLLGVDQWVDLTLQTFNAGSTMTQHTRISPGYSGNVEYSPSLGRIFYNETGISSTDITAYTLSGNTITGAESVAGDSYGSSLGRLSSDGNTFYYNRVSRRGSNLATAVATFPESILAATPTLALGAGSFYDASNGTSLGTVGYTASVWAIDPGGRDVIGVVQGTGSVTLRRHIVALSQRWLSTTGGNWSDNARWEASTPPDGADNTADFSRQTLSTDATVAMNGSRTLGRLVFGDVGGLRNWILDPGTGGTLTLQVTGASPSVTVNNTVTTLAVPVAGTQGLRKEGAGTLVLSASNTYSGGTTLIGGTLQISSDAALGSGPLSVGAATLRVTAPIASGRQISLTSSSSAIEVGASAAYTASTGTTVSGTGGLTKLGTGTLDLTAASLTYTGPTTVNAGTLLAGTLTSPSLSVAANAAASLSAPTLTLSLANSGSVAFTGTGGTVTLSTLTGTGTTTFAGNAVIATHSAGSIAVPGTATLSGATGGAALLTGPTASAAFLGNTAITLGTGTVLSVNAGTQTAGGVTGPGSLVKNSTGTLVLAADNTHSGGTTLSAGTLQVGNGGTSGTLPGNVLNNATLAFSRSDTVTFSGVISGTGSVRHAGPGTLTLAASNSYAGGTTLSGGMLLISSDAALGTGPLSIGSANLRVTAPLTSGRQLSLTASSSTLQVDASASYTATPAVTVSGTGGLTKLGAGTLDLSAATLTYTGPTTVNAGTLLGGPMVSTSISVSTGATASLAAVSFNVSSLANSGTVNFTLPTATIVVSSLSGVGVTTFAGNASLPTLSSGWVSVAGTGSIANASGGTALLNGPTASIGTLGNSAVVLGNATALSVTGGTQTTGAISGQGSLTKVGTSTLILGGDNPFSGGTTLSGGTLQLGNGGPTGSILGNVLNNATLAFARSDTFTFPGVISGTGAVRQSGPGTLVLTASHTYTGGTTITAGTLQLGDGVNAGSVLGNVANAGVLAFNTPASGQTFPGTVTGTGSLVKSGPGTLLLTAPNTHTGGTTVNAGTLRVGNGATSGSITGNVVNNATLAFDRSDTLTFPGTVTGSGRVEQAGTGTLRITGTLANALTATAGRVIVAPGATVTGDLTLAPSARVEISGGTFNIDDLDNAGILTGASEIGGVLRNRPTGDLRVNPGQSLYVQALATHTNEGLIAAFGTPSAPATFETAGPMTNLAGGSSLITARYATLRFSGGLTNHGALASTYGLTDVFGDIDNRPTGTITLAGDAGVTFYDDVVQNGTLVVSAVGSTRASAVFLGSFSGAGGFTGGGDVFLMGDLRPGNSPASVTYDGNLFLGPDSDTLIEIAGLAPGLADRVNVTGTLALDGTLTVDFIDGFRPVAMHDYQLFNASEITGRFDTLVLPTFTNDWTWDTRRLYTGGVVSIIPEPAALGLLAVPALALTRRRR